MYRRLGFPNGWSRISCWIVHRGWRGFFNLLSNYFRWSVRHIDCGKDTFGIRPVETSRIQGSGFNSIFFPFFPASYSTPISLSMKIASLVLTSIFLSSYCLVISNSLHLFRIFEAIDRISKSKCDMTATSSRVCGFWDQNCLLMKDSQLQKTLSHLEINECLTDESYLNVINLDQVQHLAFNNILDF